MSHVGFYNFDQLLRVTASIDFAKILHVHTIKCNLDAYKVSTLSDRFYPFYSTLNRIPDFHDITVHLLEFLSTLWPRWQKVNLTLCKMADSQRLSLEKRVQTVKIYYETNNSQETVKAPKAAFPWLAELQPDDGL